MPYILEIQAQNQNDRLFKIPQAAGAWDLHLKIVAYSRDEHNRFWEESHCIWLIRAEGHLKRAEMSIDLPKQVDIPVISSGATID